MSAPASQTSCDEGDNGKGAVVNANAWSASDMRRYRNRSSSLPAVLSNQYVSMAQEVVESQRNTVDGEKREGQGHPVDLHDVDVTPLTPPHNVVLTERRPLRRSIRQAAKEEERKKMSIVVPDVIEKCKKKKKGETVRIKEKEKKKMEGREEHAEGGKIRMDKEKNNRDKEEMISEKEEEGGQVDMEKGNRDNGNGETRSEKEEDKRMDKETKCRDKEEMSEKEEEGQVDEKKGNRDNGEMRSEKEEEIRMDKEKKCRDKEEMSEKEEEGKVDEKKGNRDNGEMRSGKGGVIESEEEQTETEEEQPEETKEDEDAQKLQNRERRPFTFIGMDEYDYDEDEEDCDRETLFGVDQLRKLEVDETVIELPSVLPVFIPEKDVSEEYLKFCDRSHFVVNLILSYKRGTNEEINGVPDNLGIRNFYYVLWGNDSFAWTGTAEPEAMVEYQFRMGALKCCAKLIKGKEELPKAKDFEKKNVTRHHKLALVEGNWNRILLKCFLPKLYLLNTVDEETIALDFTYIPAIKYSKSMLTQLKEREGNPSNYQKTCNCPPGEDQCNRRTCKCWSDGRHYLKGGVVSTRQTMGFLTECGEGCGCKGRCSRSLLQRGRKHPLVLCKEAEDKGWSLRAACNIGKGEFVGEMTGEVLTVEEADEDGRNLTYQMSLKDIAQDERYAVLDAECMGNEMRYANHSCDPNAVVLSVYSSSFRDQMSRVGIFANRNIRKGEEITYDYYRGMDDDERKSLEPSDRIACLCGSTKCSQFMPTVVTESESPKKEKVRRRSARV